MTDLLELLKQQVSAIVLDGESEHLFEKNNALNQFYPILLSVFKAKPGLIASLADQLNPRLIDIFQSNIGLKEKFLDTVSGAAPAPRDGAGAYGRGRSGMDGPVRTTDGGIGAGVHGRPADGRTRRD